MPLYQIGYKILLNDAETCQRLATENRWWISSTALSHCDDVPKTVTRIYTRAGGGHSSYQLRQGRETIRYDYPEEMIKCIYQKKRLRLVVKKT